ncbi:zinc-binding dehydrogenase [Loktanella salsilacus]|uniref:zinc-binding dehydrogenase n=1 Tax=Loktanella salsilacus TaxID=195913 RepID=UPI0020B67DC3|nr:zinc-binding dehydrogenase [Loktanella salsilacus]UTH44537.1 zinc-binding dehydrogenase [Loktanella salsilacus]
MRAAIHDTFGVPADVLKTETVDTPIPGKGEVLIKTILSPIHNHDLWTVRGNYGYKPELPGAIGGSEAIGTVASVGEGVDEAMIGKRVTIAGVHGTWAEYFTAPAAGVLPLPDSIPDILGAQLIAMPFSAISLLELLQAKPGDWIIQTAANGAVGKIMAVLAKSRDINLLNLVRREEAVKELTDLGMDNVLSTSTEGWQKQARTLIGKAGAVSAIDSVGGEMGAELVDLLGVNGELYVFGTATGAPLQLNSGALIMKQITVKGFWGSMVSNDMDPADRKRLITELLTLAVKGELTLEDGGAFDLDDVTEAMKAALTPGRAGKVMLRG